VAPMRRMERLPGFDSISIGLAITECGKVSMIWGSLGDSERFRRMHKMGWSIHNMLAQSIPCPQ
jgi:hypothetical protein